MKATILVGLLLAGCFDSGAPCAVSAINYNVSDLAEAYCTWRSCDHPPGPGRDLAVSRCVAEVHRSMCQTWDCASGLPPEVLEQIPGCFEVIYNADVCTPFPTAECGTILNF